MAVPQPEITRHRHDAHDDVVTRGSPAFGLNQIIAMAMGIFFLVMGALGLARGGVESWTSPTVEVAGLGMTPLLAAIHLVVGIIAMIGAASRLEARGTGMFLGALLVAGGIVALVQSIDALGWTEANGVAYLIIGIVAMLAAAITPIVIGRRHVIEH